MNNEEYRIEGDRSEVTPESPRRLLIEGFIMLVATGLVMVLLGLSIYQGKEIDNLEQKLNFAKEVAKDCIKNK